MWQDLGFEMRDLVRGKRAKRAAACWIAEKIVLSLPSCSPLLHWTRVFWRSPSLDFLGFSDKPFRLVLQKSTEKKKALLGMPGAICTYLHRWNADHEWLVNYYSPHFQLPCFRRRIPFTPSQGSCCFLSIPNLSPTLKRNQSTPKVTNID